LYVVSSLDSVVVKKSNFYRNRSFFEGGGIFTTGYLKMENCEVSHNSAREAGGLYSQADSLVVLSSSFDSNHSNTPLNGLLSTSVHGGGGIYLISGKATFVDTDFTGNTTTLQGGAILSEKSSPTFYNCTFQNNKALLLNANQVNLQKGGAIYMDVEGDLGLHRCSLIGNEAVDGGGGILLADICNLYISNTVMSDNSSFHLFFEGTNTGEIRNSTFTRTNNNAFNGDLRWNGALSFEVYNSIFYGHDILISEIGDVTMFNCIAEGGFLNGSNISDVDPLLVDPANGDFQLGTGSPAIDAGDNGYVNSTMDLLGNLRIDTVNNFVDMGAVEVQSPPAMNTCNEHLMLTGTIASGTYQASGYITCNGTIPAGANVVLSAPGSIVMAENFNVISTGTFEVNDVGCNE